MKQQGALGIIFPDSMGEPGEVLDPIGHRREPVDRALVFQFTAPKKFVAVKLNEFQFISRATTKSATKPGATIPPGVVTIIFCMSFSFEFI
jgi:hypothetical protein